jgi:hypothetical protein
LCSDGPRGLRLRLDEQASAVSAGPGELDTYYAAGAVVSSIKADQSLGARSERGAT